MSKILILANNSTGLYIFRNELVERLLKEGHEIVVSIPDTEHVLELEDEGCHIINTEMDRRGTNPLHDYKLYRFYRSLLKSEKPDMVLTYTIKPNVYGGYACRKEHVPYISTVTGLGSSFEWTGIKKKMIVTMYKMGLKGCRCVFFQNAANKKLFEELNIKGQGSELVNGSGVNLEKHSYEDYPGHKDDITRFLYIGRIMREKGIDEYLYAARKLREKYGDKVSVSVLGYSDEDYEVQLKRAVRDKYLKVIPFQKNVHPYIKEADAIVLPSYHEGMSNVLMEAAATGRPVLTTNINGCKETVDDGISGILFKPRDQEALLNAMELFAELPQQQRAEMGRCGRNKMEKEFDRKKIVQAYVSKINEIIKKNN
ncbi:MAG: glycosyltransferase family 4 protein [Butyrivibrio sp.]|nr:glycosyltransferase family 4 protein [Butyrivibrio sp.]